MTAAAKSKASAKPRKPRGKPWKKGQSGNPKGAPKRGESWAEIIKRVGELTPSEAAARSQELAEKLRAIGDAVTLKEAVVIRIYAALLEDPNPGLVNSFMDRSDGKVKEQLELTGKQGGALRVEYVNDWRGTAADAAPGPEVGADAIAPLQLAGGRAPLAEDDAGDVDRG